MKFNMSGLHNPEFGALSAERRQEVMQALQTRQPATTPVLTERPETQEIMACIQVDSLPFMMALDKHTQGCGGVGDRLRSCHRSLVHIKRVVLGSAAEAAENIEVKRRPARINHILGRTMVALKSIPSTPETASILNFKLVEGKPYQPAKHVKELEAYAIQREEEVSTAEDITTFVSCSEDLFRSALQCPQSELDVFVRALESLQSETEGRVPEKIRKRWLWQHS